MHFVFRGTRFSFLVENIGFQHILRLTFFPLMLVFRAFLPRPLHKILFPLSIPVYCFQLLTLFSWCCWNNCTNLSTMLVLLSSLTYIHLVLIYYFTSYILLIYHFQLYRSFSFFGVYTKILRSFISFQNCFLVPRQIGEKIGNVRVSGRRLSAFLSLSGQGSLQYKTKQITTRTTTTTNQQQQKTKKKGGAGLRDHKKRRNP